MKDSGSIGSILGIILGLTTFAGASSADQLQWPPGSPPQSPRPLSELSAEWWQWVYSIPQPYTISVDGTSYTNQPPFNPLLDLTGASCMAGQRGSVWFLAGTNGATGPVTRSCSVPQGASIFFPVIAFSNSNTPGCPPGTPLMDAKALQAVLPPAIESVNSNPLFVTLDGADVTRTLVKLVQSEPFELAFPAQNAFGPFACSPAPVPLSPGIYSPVVAEGYYVWLPPLKPGSHTIAFSASGQTSFFASNVQNVAYTITVVPVSLK
jgi:hypothetical protein